MTKYRVRIAALVANTMVERRLETQESLDQDEEKDTVWRALGRPQPRNPATINVHLYEKCI